MGNSKPQHYEVYKAIENARDEPISHSMEPSELKSTLTLDEKLLLFKLYKRGELPRKSVSFMLDNALDRFESKEWENVGLSEKLNETDFGF
jgi:hypothetical protein